MNAILAPFRILVIALSMLFFTVLTFILLLITWNRDFVIRLIPNTLWGPFVLWVCGMKVEVKGLENIDKENYYIYVANHQSMLDIPLTVATIPVNLYFMLKQELKKSPFVGWYSMAVGMIFVDRKNKERAKASLKQAGELIKKGKNVLVYPEGTRSPDGRLLQFKKGAFAVAQAGGIGIVPFAIIGTEKVLPKGAWIIKPGRIVVHIGKPVPYEELQDLSTIQMANLLQEKVRELKENT